MEDFSDLSEKIIKDSEEIQGNQEEGVGGQILEILLNTREQCEMVDQLIKNQINVKDEMINKLHKELEYYKQESAERFIEQFIKAVIKVRKDMERMIFKGKWNEMSVEDMQREYTYIFEDLTDLLEQQNVDAYRTEPGEDFNPSIHQPKLERTDILALDKKVKESISDGYIRGEKVLIPERVIVYQYKE